jgi:purine nucleoside phosphorylase
MRCLALSIITNLAAGLAAGRLSHAEVILAAEEAGERLERLMTGVIARS